jgi:glycosyltransferase involved in cell wall biosynthesis
MVTISILIPAFNEERTIKQVLKTVSQQQIPNVVFEVVVVNDGSTDNTLKILNENCPTSACVRQIGVLD